MDEMPNNQPNNANNILALPRDRSKKIPNNTNEQYERIHILVSRGFKFAELVKELGIAKSTLSTILKTMEVKGLIQRRRIGRLLLLTIPLGIANNLKSVDLPSYRIHDCWLTLNLKDPIANDTTRLLLDRGIALSSARHLRHHIDSYFITDGWEACLSPSSLEVHLPDLDGLSLNADLRQAVLEMFGKLEAAIAKLEDRLGLKVMRIDKDTLIAKISQLHIALKNHEFAQVVNDKGEKLYVYVQGELRVVVDKSHGLDEYEAVSPTMSVPDASRLGKLTEGVITNKFDYEKDHELLHMLVKEQAAAAARQDRTDGQVEQIAIQLNIHAPWLNAWKVVADATENPAKRARAQKAIRELHDPYQRKL